MQLVMTYDNFRTPYVNFSQVVIGYGDLFLLRGMVKGKGNDHSVSTLYT